MINEILVADPSDEYIWQDYTQGRHQKTQPLAGPTNKAKP
jgi:hypothetical protein